MSCSLQHSTPVLGMAVAHLHSLAYFALWCFMIMGEAGVPVKAIRLGFLTLLLTSRVVLLKDSHLLTRVAALILVPY